MILLAAYPMPTHQLVLPDPVLGDALDLTTSVTVLTAMDGSRRAYRHTPARRAREMRFDNVTLTKAVEARAFLVATQGKLLRMVDWEDKSWRGFIITDPDEIRTTSRGLGNEPRPEWVDFQLTFEGVLL